MLSNTDWTTNQVDEIYGPVAQNNFAGYLLVHTFSDPESMTRVIRDAVHQADSQIAIDRIKTLEQVRQDSVASPRYRDLLGLLQCWHC